MALTNVLKVLDGEISSDSLQRAIDECVEKWSQLGHYAPQEESLIKLFHDYPNNTGCFNDVLIKTTVLDSFYGTNLRFGNNTKNIENAELSIVKIAQMISNKETCFDERMKDGMPCFIDELSGRFVAEYKERGIISFLSKFCSFHDEEHNKYPLYDTQVREMLRFINRKRQFFIRGSDLESYCGFKDIVDLFREKFKLEKYTYKETDEFLWIAGQIKQITETFRGELTKAKEAIVDEVDLGSYESVYTFGCKVGFEF